MVVVGLAVAGPPMTELWAPAAEDATAAAHARLGALARPKLLEFYAERCLVCERIRLLVEQLRDDCVGHRVDVVQINVADPANAAIVRRHGIRAVPTFVMLDEQGTATGKLYGERTLSELRAAAGGLIGASCAGEAARGALPAGDSLPACATGDSAAPPVEQEPADALRAECGRDGLPEASIN